MKLGSTLVPPVIFAALFASALSALAQTPDPGAVAQENRDIAGRWLGATDAAIQSAGKAGGTLTNIATGKFEGLSKSISIADAASTLGAASAGDVRGTVSGAAAIAVGGKVTAGGAALFGEIGAITGGAVGSFFPVIGNIAGSVVGGAIGTAAGGFIAAFGYDKYVKDYVAKGATGIVSVFDKAPLAEAMEAKRAFLWATMAPEERAQLTAFKPEEVALIDFGTLPYVPVPKQPAPNVPATPSPQDQAALTTGNVLADVRRFRVGGDHDQFAQVWEISGGIATYRSETPGTTHVTLIWRGSVSVNRIEGTLSGEWRTDTGDCRMVTRSTASFVMTFDANAVSATVGVSSPLQLVMQQGSCRLVSSEPNPGLSFTDSWRKLD